MAYVFVYGTLKSGYPADWLMKRNGVLLGNAQARGTLFNLGPFPGYRREGEYQVKGELWEVSEQGVSQLDRYEGEGSLYDRVEVEVQTDNGKNQNVFIYEIREAGEEDEVISSGEWTLQILMSAIDKPER